MEVDVDVNLEKPVKAKLPELEQRKAYVELLCSAVTRALKMTGFGPHDMEMIKPQEYRDAIISILVAVSEKKIPLVKFEDYSTSDVRVLKELSQLEPPPKIEVKK